MLRNLLFICLFAVNGYAVTGFTWFWNVKLTGDTATVLRLKSNNDTTLNWSNRISDTLNRKVVHFGSGSLTHDSTLRYLKVDTLRSNPNVDSITIRHAFIDTLHGLLYNKGRVVSDTTATTYGSATYFTGDSIYNRAIRNTGTVTSDSANIRAIGGTTKTDSINSIKGIKAPVFVGPVIGNVTGISDSATGVVRAAKLTTARTISGTSFDGSANVTIIPDSAKGAHHLNGGNVDADSLNVHGTVIQKNGNVGIGTTSPVSPLTVKGNFVDTGNALITGTLIADSIYARAISSVQTSSFPCTLTGVTTTVIGVAKYTKYGQNVFLNLPTLSGTSNSPFTTIKGFPLDIRSLINGNPGYIQAVGLDSGMVQPFLINPNSSASEWNVTKARAVFFSNSQQKVIYNNSILLINGN